MIALYWFAASTATLSLFGALNLLGHHRRQSSTGGSKFQQFSGLDHGRLNIPPAE